MYEVGPNVKLITPTSGATRYRFRLSLVRIGPRHDLATLNQFIEFREAKFLALPKR